MCETDGFDLFLVLFRLLKAEMGWGRNIIG